MSKQLKELKQFTQGTISSPSASDIPENSNVYSKNLEPIDEVGKLKGAKEDTKFKGALGFNYNIVNLAYGNESGETGTTIPDDIGENPAANVNLLVHTDVIEVTVTGDKDTGSFTETASYTLTDLSGTNSTDAADLKSNNNKGWAELSLLVAALTNVSECVPTRYSPVTDDGKASGLNSDIFVGFDIIFNTDVGEPKVTVKLTHSSTVYNNREAGDEATYEDATQYPTINANNMISFNDGSLQNIAYFSKTELDTELPATDLTGDDNAEGSDDVTIESSPRDTSRMKVLEDIYGEASKKITYVDYNGEIIYNDIPDVDRVSLQQQSGAVYIGTGNQKANKAKWYGKIRQSQFSKQLIDYTVQDSECIPLESGAGTFNLSYIIHPWTRGSGTDDPSTSEAYNRDVLIGIAPTSKYIHMIGDKDTTDPTSSNRGPQARSSDSF